MEGTRHEKIILVLVSYVIGFITAFIAFGLRNDNTPVVLTLQTTTSLPLHETSKEISTKKRINDVGFSRDGLYIVADGEERILSADKSALSASVITARENVPGFYYTIIDAEVSRDGQFAYFCEQRIAEDSVCYPYVYSITDDTVHAVQKNKILYTSPVASHQSSWSENGILTLNSLKSENSSTPWILAPQEE